MALQHILAAMSYMMHQRKSFVHSIMGCVIEPPLLSAAEEKHHQKKEKKIIFHGLIFLHSTYVSLLIRDTQTFHLYCIKEKMLSEMTINEYQNEH